MVQIAWIDHSETAIEVQLLRNEGKAVVPLSCERGDLLMRSAVKSLNRVPSAEYEMKHSR
jgi:hypothetical protein